MTLQKTKSLTLSTNPVARLRELADLDAPVPPVHRLTDDSNAAAPQHSHNGSQQPDSAEAHQQASAETHEDSNLDTPTRDSAATLPQANTETQPHSGVALLARRRLPGATSARRLQA